MAPESSLLMSMKAITAFVDYFGNERFLRQRYVVIVVHRMASDGRVSLPSHGLARENCNGGTNSTINAALTDTAAFVHGKLIFTIQLYMLSSNYQLLCPDSGLTFVDGKCVISVSSFSNGLRCRHGEQRRF